MTSKKKAPKKEYSLEDFKNLPPHNSWMDREQKKTLKEAWRDFFSKNWIAHTYSFYMDKNPNSEFSPYAKVWIPRVIGRRFYDLGFFTSGWEMIKAGGFDDGEEVPLGEAMIDAGMQGFAIMEENAIYMGF